MADILERLRTTPADYERAYGRPCPSPADYHDAAVEIARLRAALANTLALARVKWGNLDANANTVFAEAEALLAADRLR